MTIAILNYNGGNTRSVALALRRLGAEVEITDDPAKLRCSEKLIIPGVGAARPAMAYLCERGLDLVIKECRQPVLGICLGQQIFCQWSAEEDTDGLGIFPLEVASFEKPKKIPHMGWNEITDRRGDLFQGLPKEAYTYFVHSYRVAESEFTTAVCEYGERFSAGLQKGNFYSVQFHPERSGPVGEQILRNFLQL